MIKLNKKGQAATSLLFWAAFSIIIAALALSPAIDKSKNSYLTAQFGNTEGSWFSPPGDGGDGGEEGGSDAPGDGSGGDGGGTTPPGGDDDDEGTTPPGGDGDDDGDGPDDGDNCDGACSNGQTCDDYEGVYYCTCDSVSDDGGDDDKKNACTKEGGLCVKSVESCEQSGGNESGLSCGESEWQTCCFGKDDSGDDDDDDDDDEEDRFTR